MCSLLNGSIVEDTIQYLRLVFFPEMGFNPVKCVLFDMDGLLLDTENLYSEGTQKVLSQFGDKVPYF
jgi:hypothetical protein